MSTTINNNNTNNKTTSKKNIDAQKMFVHLNEALVTKGFEWLLANFKVTPLEKDDDSNKIFEMDITPSALVSAYKNAVGLDSGKKRNPRKIPEDNCRCIYANKSNKRCTMPKLKKPKADDNKDACANHNRLEKNGHDLVVYDPDTMLPDDAVPEPEKKVPAKRGRKKKADAQPEDDPVANLVHNLQKSEAEEKDNKPKTKHQTANDLVQASLEVMNDPANETETQATTCSFTYKRAVKADGKKKGDTCGAENCKKPSHKKASGSDSDSGLSDHEKAEKAAKKSTTKTKRKTRNEMIVPDSDDEGEDPPAEPENTTTTTTTDTTSTELDTTTTTVTDPDETQDMVEDEIVDDDIGDIEVDLGDDEEDDDDDDDMDFVNTMKVTIDGEKVKLLIKEDGIAYKETEDSYIPLGKVVDGKFDKF